MVVISDERMIIFCVQLEIRKVFTFSATKTTPVITCELRANVTFKGTPSTPMNYEKEAPRRNLAPKKLQGPQTEKMKKKKKKMLLK